VCLYPYAICLRPNVSQHLFFTQYYLINLRLNLLVSHTALGTALSQASGRREPVWERKGCEWL